MAATFNNPNSAIPADVMTPGVGDIVYFFDLSNGNKLSFMDNARTVTVVVTDDASCCACVITEEITKKMACALAEGTITMTEFNTFVAAGLTVTAVESEVDGVKTCSVTISQPA